MSGYQAYALRGARNRAQPHRDDARGLARLAAGERAADPTAPNRQPRRDDPDHAPGEVETRGARCARDGRHEERFHWRGGRLGYLESRAFMSNWE